MKPLRALALAALLGGSAAAYAEGPGLEGEIQYSSTPSGPELAQFADQGLQDINNAVATVNKLLDAARKAKQRDAVDCLERKVSPLQKVQESGRLSSAAIKRALDENDTVHADQEFRKLAVAVTKSNEFLEAAQQCVASPDTLKGRTDKSIASSKDNLIDVDDQDEGVLIEAAISPS